MPPVQSFAQFDLIASPVFVLEISANGEPVYVAFNEKARRLAGRPLSDYIGRSARDVYPKAYGRTAYRHHCDVRDSGCSLVYQLDLPVAGRIRTFQTTLQPECDASGKVVRMIGSSIDLTAEKAAKEAKAEFDTLASEMEQFVALAAHDLRTPMRNITAITDLLLDEFDDQGDGKVELIQTLAKIATKSTELITDVLSHVESVRVHSKASTFSFPALCHDIFGTLDPLHLHDITVPTTTMRTDRTAMQIAVRNLVENTIKHGGRKHLAMTFDVRKTAAGMVEVTLTDNGRGFSPDGLALMNRGKFRAESGYGLFAVKRMIDARGGTLCAHNLACGQGAVVRFTLPGDCITATPKSNGMPFDAGPPAETFPLIVKHRA